MKQNLTKTLKNSKISKETQYEIEPTKRSRKQKTSLKAIYPNINFGKWNPTQNQLYLQFLIDHQEDFLIEGSRRRNKIFIQMEKVITTRCADQCRSHHQKVQTFCKTTNIFELIDYLTAKINGSEEYRLQVQKRIKERRTPKVEEEIKKRECSHPGIQKKSGGIFVIEVNLDKIAKWMV